MRRAFSVLFLTILILTLTSCKGSNKIAETVLNNEDSYDKNSINNEDDSLRVEVDKTFTGSGNHWDVTYSIKGFLEYELDDGKLYTNSDGYYELITTYKGNVEELKDVRNYSVVTPWGASISSGTGYMSKDIIQGGNVGEGTLLGICKGEEDEISVTVKWDGMYGGEEEIIIKTN